MVQADTFKVKWDINDLEQFHCAGGERGISMHCLRQSIDLVLRTSALNAPNRRIYPSRVQIV